MVSPSEVTTRVEFHDAIAQLIRLSDISAERRNAVAAEAQRRGFVVEFPSRGTPYNWARSSLPQRNDGPFLGFLISRGVPADRLQEWIDALESIRTDPPDSGGSANGVAIDTGDAPDGDGPPSQSGEETPPARRRRRWAVWTGVVVVAAVVGTVVAVNVLPADGNRLPSALAEPVFTEDFEGDRLNLQKWIAPTDPTHLYPRDNVLNMLGSTQPGQGVNVDLTSQDIGTFREIDFVLGVPEYRQPGSGGGSLVVRERGGRTHKVVFGPSPGPIPLSVAILACQRPTCTKYDDYVPPPFPPPVTQRFQLGEPVPVKVVHDDSKITFWMRDTMIAEVASQEPLEAFTFNSYAEPGEQWRSTVDAVRVYR